MEQHEAFRRLESFLDLKTNWDSYGAPPIRPLAVEWAKRCLYRLGDGWQPVPMNDGGVQLEWHQDGVDMELAIWPVDDPTPPTSGEGKL